MNLVRVDSEGRPYKRPFWFPKLKDLADRAYNLARSALDATDDHEKRLRYLDQRTEALENLVARFLLPDD